MNPKKKISSYEDLVKKVNSCSKGECRGKVKMTHCESCNEVNLWTYWEGGRDRLDAEILVVGQDWGKLPDRKKTEATLQKAGDARGGFGYVNMFPEPVSQTDLHLCQLMKEIDGCEDVESDYKQTGRKCKKVFFTNYVCCYREDNTSGKFDSVWTENCKEHFVNLVEIIQPKIIICLGRKTYDSVLQAGGMAPSKGSYNAIILNSGERGGTMIKIGRTIVRVFPAAHPGTMGTLNRCRAKDNDSKEIKKEIGLALQKNDWKKINQYLGQEENCGQRE